jgi:predicted nucleotidyltransferase
MDVIEIVTDVIPLRLPETQVVYLFGSILDDLASPEEPITAGGPWHTKSGDIDLAVLLPPAKAKAIGTLLFSDLRFELERRLQRDVDIINLRTVSTVFQNEIVSTGRVIFLQDRNAMEDFEMLTLSFYQKLNEEREGILDDFFTSGRAYKV